MAQPLIQSSFSSGELSVNLFGRVDLDKYSTGLALMRNFFVDYRGGASTRPGTKFIDRTRLPALKARLIPFVFSQAQSYVLEIGEHYIRFFSNGAAVLEASVAIIGISATHPPVVNAPAHGFSLDNTIYITGVQGMSQVNNQTYRVVPVDVDHFYLEDLDGNAINGSGWSPYISGGTAARVYTISSPWASADLPLLKFVQSADVMTFTHTLYPIYNLSRIGSATFTLTPEVIGATLSSPIISVVSASSAGNLTYTYQVVAVSASGERSLPSTTASADSVALNPTAATPAVIGIDWTPGIITADHYDIFKAGPVLNTYPQPTVLGYIGSTTSTQFTDINIAPDFTNGPPQFRDPFTSPTPANFPGCVTYFDQRRTYGGLRFSPEELDFSRTGAYSNFDVSFAVLDSDAIQIAIASRQVNQVQFMVPMSAGLVVFTTGGAFQVTGGGGGTAITPSNITALPQASSGCHDHIPPIVVNYDILFVQNKGSTVRDLAYNFYLQTYYGFDRSALSNHLFFGHQLLEWAYAEEPFKLVWVARDDGRLLSMTYVPEQEVYGWAQHDTQGAFESICSVPEGDEDAVYVIVRRVVQSGQILRFVERLASRKFVRIEDVWSVDCGVGIVLSRPGFELAMDNTGPTQVTLTAIGAAPFSSSWQDMIIWPDVGGKLQVASIVSAEVIICAILQSPQNIVPDLFPLQYMNIPAGQWETGPLTSQVTNLQHLAGLRVEVVADGQSIGPLTVSPSGVVALPQPASKVTVGLGFQAQLKTLPLDTGEPTIQGKRKKIAAMTLRLDQSRGLQAGGTFTTLTPIYKLPPGPYTPPRPLFTGDIRTTINGAWTEEGQVCVQQDDPFPSTVLGIIPEVIVGDTQR